MDVSPTATPAQLLRIASCILARPCTQAVLQTGVDVDPPMAMKSPSTQPLIPEVYTAAHGEGSLSTRGVKLERLMMVADVALASTVSPKNAARRLENPIVRLPWNVVFLVSGSGLDHRGLWTTVTLGFRSQGAQYKAAISTCTRTVVRTSEYEGVGLDDVLRCGLFAVGVRRSEMCCCVPIARCQFYGEVHVAVDTSDSKMFCSLPSQESEEEPSVFQQIAPNSRLVAMQYGLCDPANRAAVERLPVKLEEIHARTTFASNAH